MNRPLISTNAEFLYIYCLSIQKFVHHRSKLDEVDSTAVVLVRL